MTARKQLIRDFHAGQYLDLFFVSGISSILIIRFFLHLTGYPKVGGNGLHVAHVLWGGLMMLAAHVIALSYIGRRSRQISALVGGVGFGMFIDEVGKFVTQDNDYFYRPALALMYVTFVLTYLTARSIHRKSAVRSEEYLVNALQEVENVAIGDLDREERDRALSHLEKADATDPLVAALREVLGRVELVPTPDPHPLVRLRAAAAEFYRRLAAREHFARVVIAFFIIQLALKSAHVTAMIVWPNFELQMLPLARPVRRDVSGLTFAEWAQISSTLLSAALVLLGIFFLRISRVRGFRMLQRSILVSIFLTQLFTFYRHQWSALTILAFNLLVLTALNFVLDQEEAREGAHSARPSRI